MKTATTTEERIREETINFLRTKLDQIRDDARANASGAFDLQTELYTIVHRLEGDAYQKTLNNDNKKRNTSRGI